jgi:hypothetical protein
MHIREGCLIFRALARPREILHTTSLIPALRFPLRMLINIELANIQFSIKQIIPRKTMKQLLKKAQTLL